MAIKTLLPKKLGKEDASYQTVEELNRVLESAKAEHIRNVALTGPFGSGKSSVLLTLMENFKNRKYLSISLATLQANKEETTSDETSQEKETEEEKEKRIESLNRKIEYSILQQLIYKEKTSTVPNSRFRRIVHLSKKEIRAYSVGIVGFALAFLVLFEPAWARVDSLYKIFDWGNTRNAFADVVAALYLIFSMYVVCRYVIRSYCNSKLNKLNLKDGEIEVIENNSIFNKHLDEILYFFQVTDYNVVVIEDLDRFGTSNIFLKLRELNQLINESKIVGRHITFVYAVKDDIFKDEERTKFFDYITTVIPVINPSNSKDKLKEALKEKGFPEGEIADDDLSEMAFFIQDMRILTNIVNEYKQYRDKLCTGENQQLNQTKLLAMIVYKNYFPQDFAQLHRREGKVYKCISRKRDMVDYCKNVTECQLEDLTKKEQVYNATKHLQESELRYLFLVDTKDSINARITGYQIDNQGYKTLKEIANCKEWFDALVEKEHISFQQFDTYYANRYSNNSTNTRLSAISGHKQYLDRIAAIENRSKDFNTERKALKQKIIQIHALTIKEMLNQYDGLGDADFYAEIRKEPMLDIFIRRGYLDEEYYDYISYFYEGMVSLSDRDLLQSIKQRIAKPHDWHIDKVANVVKELKPYMFQHDAILNNDLLDYLATNSSELFNHIMLRMERENTPLDFLAQYYLYGTQQGPVFTHFIEWNRELSWKQIVNWTDKDQRDTLIEAWLKYAGKVDTTPQEWLDTNFDFLAEHKDGIGLNRALSLVIGSAFTSLSDTDDDLLDCAIENTCYELTAHNLLIITERLCKGDSTITAENLNLTKIEATGNETFISAVKENFKEALSYLKDGDKNESVPCLLYILNHADIDESCKSTYLAGQTNHVEDFAGISEQFRELAVKLFLLKPAWENVTFCYKELGGITDNWLTFINHYAQELATQRYSDASNSHEIFNALFDSDNLSTDIYQKLLDSFDCVFDGHEELDSLDKEHLLILLAKEKIPFTQENVQIINNTPIFAKYLIHYSKKFVANLSWQYNFSPASAFEIMSSGKFSQKELADIIAIIDDATLQNARQPFADLLLPVLLSNEKIIIEKSASIHLLEKSLHRENKTRYAILLIRQYKEEGPIEEILNSLGGEYSEITDSSKRPLLENTSYNRSLLDVLANLHFISSYKDDKKNKLRVYPKNKKD